MRIGIRLAISGLVLASIIITAAGVHFLWWRTAEANSHTLAATINEQIVSAARGRRRNGALWPTSAGARCFTQSALRDDHVHFIDGAQGGYTAAATALKRENASAV
jgi:hypothetical protein